MARKGRALSEMKQKLEDVKRLKLNIREFWINDGNANAVHVCCYAGEIFGA